MDCWIASTAAALKKILLTEDKDLKVILKTMPETKILLLGHGRIYRTI
ncbi:MAG: hypothetical protein ACFFD2_10290 [Promethearchaeota archaeon]